MYGLILENMAEYIKQTYGEDKWEEIRRAAAVEQPSFSTHQVYSEALIPRLAKKAIQVKWKNVHVPKTRHPPWNVLCLCNYVIKNTVNIRLLSVTLHV